MLFSRDKLLAPPPEEVVQCGVRVAADLGLVPMVPYFKADEDHTEVELLVEL